MDKREKQRDASKRWRAENRERHRVSVRVWKLANPEKAREKNRRRTALRKVARAAAREVRLIETADARAAAKIASTEARRIKSRARYLAKRDQDRERSRASSKAWREANPGKSAILQKAWKEKNREKVRASKRARKVAKRVTLVRELTKLQRGKCAYCRERLGAEFHVDHVMPLKRGGPDRRSNLQLTCIACNQAKSAQHPITFAQSKGMLL